MIATLLLCGTLLAAQNIPTIDESALEPAVAEQISASRAQLAAALETSGINDEQRAEVWGELGRLFHAYDLTEQALQAYAEAARLSPNGAAWPYYMGIIELDRGESESALEHLTRAYQLRPDTVPTRLKIAAALINLDRPDEALDVLESTLELSPGEPATLAALGELELASGNYGNARRWLTQALAAEPRATRLHYPLALALRGLGDEDAAREHLQQVGTAGVRPADPMLDALNSLKRGERVNILQGRLALGAGDVEAAIALFRKALEANPDSTGPRVNLATALALDGRIQEAFSILEENIELHPTHLTTMYNLGMLHLQVGNLAEGRRWLEAYEAEGDYDVDVVTRLAQLDRQQGDYQAAAERLYRLLSVYPDQARLWHRLAATLVDAQDYSAAISVLHEGLKRHPQDAALLTATTRLLASSPDHATRDGAGAVTVAQVLYEQQPDASTAHLVAMAYAEAGDCAVAAEWLDRAAGQSDDATASYQLTSLAEKIAGQSECRP